MPQRLDDCVKKVAAKARANPKKYQVTKKHTATQAAYAICTKSLGLTKEAKARKSAALKHAAKKRLT